MTHFEAASIDSVGVVVVNFNGDGVVERCLRSLLLNTSVAEVVVVDNNSTDGSVETLKGFVAANKIDARIEIVEANANLGYGRACNLGARRLSSRYILISNPDIVYEAGAIDRLVEAQVRWDLGGVGPYIVNPDNSRYPSVRPFPSLVNAAMHSLLGEIWPTNPFTKRYRVDFAKVNFKDRWISGASILMPLELYRGVGGFDHRYFMYMEDVDLCRRILDKGFELGYCEEAVATHYQGYSSRQRPYFSAYAHHRSLAIYAISDLKGARRLLLPVVLLGVTVRFSIRMANISMQKLSK